MFLNISKGMQTLLTIWSTFFMVGRSVTAVTRMRTPTAIISAIGTTTRAAIRKLFISITPVSNSDTIVRFYRLLVNRFRGISPGMGLVMPVRRALSRPPAM